MYYIFTFMNGKGKTFSYKSHFFIEKKEGMNHDGNVFEELSQIGLIW